MEEVLATPRRCTPAGAPTYHPLIKARGGESLSEFAHRVAALLQLGGIERRLSSSYIDEQYFKGSALSVVVKFAKADESDLDGYDFWIHLKPTEVWIEDPAFVDGLADLLAAVLLASESKWSNRRCGARAQSKGVLRSR